MELAEIRRLRCYRHVERMAEWNVMSEYRLVTVERKMGVGTPCKPWKKGGEDNGKVGPEQRDISES